MWQHQTEISPKKPPGERLAESERGVVLVFVSLAMVALLGIAALAIDVGHLYWVRRELQTSADAAVLAAVERLPSTPAAQASALQYADLNRSGSLAASDVVFGYWDDVSDTFTPGGGPLNAVEVTTRELVELFFAPVLGIDDSDVAAVSVAMKAVSIIDFEGLSPGEKPTELTSGSGISGPFIDGGVSITGSQRGPMIFDATCNGGPPSNCSGGDSDLYQPAQENVLIITEDGNSNDPDDDAGGGWFELDFSGYGVGSVTVASLVLIDAEEGGSVTLYRNGEVVDVVILGGVSDGEKEYRFVSEVGGIDFIRIELNGSGAIDDIGYQSIGFLVR